MWKDICFEKPSSCIGRGSVILLLFFTTSCVVNIVDTELNYDAHRLAKRLSPNTRNLLL